MHFFKYQITTDFESAINKILQIIWCNDLTLPLHKIHELTKKCHPKPWMHSYSCWLTTRKLKLKTRRLSRKLSIREQQLSGASTETMLSSSASSLPMCGDCNKTRGSLNSEAWRASGEMLWAKTRPICHLGYSEGHPLPVRKAGLPGKVRFTWT